MSALIEMHGVAWCITHDYPWYEGDTECNDPDPVGGDCVEVPLYRGQP